MQVQYRITVGLYKCITSVYYIFVAMSMVGSQASEESKQSELHCKHYKFWYAPCTEKKLVILTF